MRILDIARDMLDRRAEYIELLDTGWPHAAGLALDEEAIAAAEIRARLAALVPA